MGTIRFNRQRAKWGIDYVDAQGIRVRQLIGAGEEGKRLAKQILQQRKAEATLGIHHLPASRTDRFEEFADDWLHRVSPRLRPKSLEAYRGAVDCHLRPAFGEVRLGALTRRAIEGFLVAKHDTGLAVATVNFLLGRLKQILDDAVEQGMLNENPAARVRPFKAAERGDEEIQILDPAQIARLLEEATDPYRSIYLVAVHTGLRSGELLGLRWGDVDLEGRLLHVRRSRGKVKLNGEWVTQEGPPKTRSSRRSVDFSATVAQTLLALSRSDDPKEDHVFLRRGHPIAANTVRNALKRHLTLAGLPEIRVHDLRHTHVALLIAAGVHPKAIQRRLGHSSINMTMDRYGHLMPDAFQGIGERLEAVLDGNGKATALRIA